MSSGGKVGIGKRGFYGALTAVTGLMLFGSIAAAQGAGNQGGDVQIAQGITARGNGDASAPADSAIVQFIVRHDESKAVAGVEPTNADMANAGGASTGEVTADDLAPLVDAAKANGIADERIDTVIVPSTAFSTPFGPGVGVLVLQLEKGDLKHRMKIADAVTKAANGNALTFDQIGAAYIVNDCETLDRAAIADAAKDAHDQADMMAEVMGL